MIKLNSHILCLLYHRYQFIPNWYSNRVTNQKRNNQSENPLHFSSRLVDKKLLFHDFRKVSVTKYFCHKFATKIQFLKIRRLLRYCFHYLGCQQVSLVRTSNIFGTNTVTSFQLGVTCVIQIGTSIRNTILYRQQVSVCM